MFPMFDVPVFWPILLLYWLLLFTVTMKRQIKHMIKYRYLPFSTGKKVSSAAQSRAGLLGGSSALPHGSRQGSAQIHRVCFRP